MEQTSKQSPGKDQASVEFPPLKIHKVHNILGVSSASFCFCFATETASPSSEFAIISQCFGNIVS